jgi:hypothetical protein
MQQINTLTKAVRYGLGAALALGLAATPLTVLAQDEQADEAEAVLEEVLVTGTKLAGNPNLMAATPVLSVMGDEAAMRGNVRMEDFVNVLPQVFAGQASDFPTVRRVPAPPTSILFRCRWLSV